VPLKSNRDSILQLLLLILLALAAIAGLTWGNYRYASQNPGGNDFLVHWVGTRAFFVDGISPYSDETALRIQEMAYGRAARPGEHELRVAYPLYSTIVFAPFALIKDFTLARAFWMTTLEIALALSALLAVRLVDWRPPIWMLAIYLLFTLLFYHSIRPLINGNAVILVTLGIILALQAIKNERDELAGLLLGLTTIKPQVVVLIILFVLLWGMAKKRWLLVGWLVGTVIVLSIAVGIIIPDWIMQNMREVIRYPAYNPAGTVGAAFATWWPAVGHRVGWVFSAILGVILLLEWVGAGRSGFRGFLWKACLTLVISQWIGIQTDPGNFIVLLLPLTLVFAMWEKRWRRGGSLLVFTSIAMLLVGIWMIFLSTVEYGNQPLQSPVMFFPLPAFLLLGLYWVRWWAFKPPSLWVDLLQEREGI